MLKLFKEKKVIVNGLILVACVFFVLTIFLFTKGTFSNEEQEKVNRLTISCPEFFISLEDISCEVYAEKTDDIKIKYIEADYISFPELSSPQNVFDYVSFNVNEVNGNLFSFRDNNIDKKGFTIGNNSSEGIDFNDERILIGTLVVRYHNPESMIEFDPFTENPQEFYNIILGNVKYTTVEDDVIRLEDAATTIKAKSRESTLEEIKFRYEYLGEEHESSISIESGKYEYDFTSMNDLLDNEAEVNDFTIDCETTDSSSTVSINGELDGKVSTHYGSNTIDIEVTSNDGNVTKYKINLFNDNFKLNQSEYSCLFKGNENDILKYGYEKVFDTSDSMIVAEGACSKDLLYDSLDGHYMYTGGDRDETIKNKLLPLLEEEMDIKISTVLSEGIGSSELEIYYGEEKIGSYPLLRVLSDYPINNNNINVPLNLEFSEFASKTKFYGEGLKLIDLGGGTPENIHSNYQLKLNFFGYDISTLTFKVSTIGFSNKLVVDRQQMIIKRIEAGTTYNDLLGLINTSGVISIESKDVTVPETNYDYVVKTGDKISVNLIDRVEVYTLSVVGDVFGTGQISDKCVNEIAEYIINGYNLLPKEIRLSADINGDGEIKMNDVMFLVSELNKIN